MSLEIATNRMQIAIQNGRDHMKSNRSQIAEKCAICGSRDLQIARSQIADRRSKIADRRKSRDLVQLSIQPPLASCLAKPRFIYAVFFVVDLPITRNTC